jgi:hypothetical protein
MAKRASSRANNHIVPGSISDRQRLYGRIGPEQTPAEEARDFGYHRTVDTMTEPGPQSSIDLKNIGLGNSQPGTGANRHKRTGRRVT